MNAKQRRKFVRALFVEFRSAAQDEQERGIVDLMEEIAFLRRENARLMQKLIAL